LKQPLFRKSGAKTSFILEHGRCSDNAPSPYYKSLFAAFSSEKEVLAFLH
jgi:hypothetical protein